MPSNNNQFEYTHILNTKKYEWYYEVKSRTMIRLPSGTRIILYPSQQDARGRTLAITEIGDYIYVEKEDILEINFH